MDDDGLIKFQAVVAKVQTTVDGGIRITLDLDSSCVEQAGQFMQVQRINGLLEVVCVVVKQSVNLQG